VLAQGADRLFDEAIVIDSLSFGHKWDSVEYEAVKRSGYTGIQTTLESESFQGAIHALAEWNERIRLNPDKLLRATRASHIEQAKSEGKLGVVFGFQNATMLEGKVENLDGLSSSGRAASSSPTTRETSSATGAPRGPTPGFRISGWASSSA
jgi:membrane dipeptidase